MVNLTVVKNAVNTTVKAVKDNSPKILLVTGLMAGAAALITACVATTKAGDILDKHNEEMEKIEEAKKVADPEEYTEKDIRMDRVRVFAHTTFGFFRLFWLTILLTLISGGSILWAFDIINKRLKYGLAALTSTMGLFGAYRENVINDVGEEKDREYLLGSHIEKKAIEEEVTDPETGKTKKVKKDAEFIDLDLDLATGNIRIMSEYNPSGDRNPEWDRHIDVMIASLKAKELWWNQVFRYYGLKHKPVTLNDVATDCGMDWTDEGQAMGWEWAEGKSISFGIPDWSDPQMRSFINGSSDSLVLTFNVDSKPIIGNNSLKKKKLKG